MHLVFYVVIIKQPGVIFMSSYNDNHSEGFCVAAQVLFQISSCRIINMFRCMLRFHESETFHAVHISCGQQ